MQRAMATEAEASREARAKVIAAQGEQNASKALKEAADVNLIFLFKYFKRCYLYNYIKIKHQGN